MMNIIVKFDIYQDNRFKILIVITIIIEVYLRRFYLINLINLFITD